jgi:hypothetical protein
MGHMSVYKRPTDPSANPFDPLPGLLVLSFPSARASAVLTLPSAEDIRPTEPEQPRRMRRANVGFTTKGDEVLSFGLGLAASDGLETRVRALTAETARKGPPHEAAPVQGLYGFDAWVLFSSQARDEKTADCACRLTGSIRAGSTSLRSQRPATSLSYSTTGSFLPIRPGSRRSTPSLSTCARRSSTSLAQTAEPSSPRSVSTRAVHLSQDLLLTLRHRRIRQRKRVMYMAHDDLPTVADLDRYRAEGEPLALIVHQLLDVTDIAAEVISSVQMDSARMCVAD